MQLEQKKCSHCSTVAGFKGRQWHIAQIKSSGTSFTGTGAGLSVSSAIVVYVLGVVVVVYALLWSLSLTCILERSDGQTS